MPVLEKRETSPRCGETKMFMPKLAAVLGVVGLVCLVLSAVLGATSMADWVLDAAQAFLLLGALVFIFYVVRGVVLEIADAA
jgi:hypothetical protein